jgi:histidine phosphotransferase ChpT
MSNYLITPKVLEILSSRICHDLVGPISAVNNGVEFWQEMGIEAGEEAVQLIGHSAQQGAYKLQLFRLAYASGGGETHIKLSDVRTCFANFSREFRAKLNWELDSDKYNGELPRGYAKLLLNILMIGVDMLPKGGEIKVYTTPNKSDKHFTVELISEDLMVNIDYKDALEGVADPDMITPRTVHPYMTRVFAQSYGVDMHISPSDKGLCFNLSHSDFE